MAALLQSGQYAAAARAAETIAASAADAGIIRQNVLLLQALIQFETNELRGATLRRRLRVRRRRRPLRVSLPPQRAARSWRTCRP